MPEQLINAISRRRFLKTAGAGALATSAGPAVVIPGRTQPRTIRILLGKSLIASSNQWRIDFAKAWGQQNDIRVIIDSVSLGAVLRQVEAEFAAGQGHDLVYPLWIAPAAYETQVIDHREIYEECEHRYGKALDFAFKSCYNPKTDKFISFFSNYLPNPVIYRKDLWDAIGRAPDSWDDIRLGGRQIKLLHERSIGISLGPKFGDGEYSLRTLLFAFGGSVQDADNRPALKSNATLEALKFAKALYEEAMSEEILAWDNVSNNRAMLAGEISLTLNAISITRTGENKQLPLADKLWLAKPPAGPARRIAVPNGEGHWVIPTFTQNREAAQSFLVDMMGKQRSFFLASDYYFLPLFPQTVSDMAQLISNDPRAMPVDKYKILAEASDWTTNVGYPGYNDPAIGEIFDNGILSTMFASAATGKMTPEEAMSQADQEVRKIYDKWRALGKV